MKITAKHKIKSWEHCDVVLDSSYSEAFQVGVSNHGQMEYWMRKTVFQECVKGCCRNQLRKGKVIWWVINWTFCWFSILFEGILGDVDQDKTKEGREYKKVNSRIKRCRPTNLQVEEKKRRRKRHSPFHLGMLMLQPCYRHIIILGTWWCLMMK